MKFHTQLKLSLFIRLRAGMPLLLSALVLALASGAAWAVPEMHDHDLIASPLSIQAQRYEFKGVVVSVDRVKRRATIKHEKVEGLMDAMTMPFLIKDDKALEEMQPGDQIVAQLVSSDDGAQWLEKVVVVAKSQKEEKKDAEKTDEEDKPFWLMGTPGNQKTPPPSRFDTDPTALYTCPMHLNYRASKPGKCPRCGMELVSAEPGITEEFRLKMEVTPKLPQPGQPVKLNFAVFNPRTGEKVKEFGLMHDRLFHLFLISQDLNDFQHIHPRRLARTGSARYRNRRDRASLTRRAALGRLPKYWDKGHVPTSIRSRSRPWQQVSADQSGDSALSGPGKRTICVADRQRRQTPEYQDLMGINDSRVSQPGSDGDAENCVVAENQDPRRDRGSGPRWTG
ncbi:MAG: copper-binding protein [Acidobacteria bacterium]|nr:copper-binding protein [Acidobacteriota bacterium]